MTKAGRWLRLAVIATAGLATPCLAQDRDYCPERPGLGTPACTIAPGRVSVETGLADWTRDDGDGTRSDTLMFGTTGVRLGLTDRVEAQVTWSPFVRQRDRKAGKVDATAGVGDARLGLKASLRAPDGEGLSIAVLPYVGLPIGRRPPGNGTWSTGVLVPVTYDLSEAVNLQFTSEVDAAANSGGRGRHLAYGGVAGIDIDLTRSVDVELELAVARDDDPVEPATMTQAALSFGWKAGPDLQFDIGGATGLNDDTPDARIYAGIARRF
ncbi:transporter [Sphingomonas sp. Leaf17]|uniref:transporter n=1 Tax=Sphingomonas sp. Leaf17 TaxID=1735683 RepID=UPI000A62E7EF|nr:transporter [Sphingomonas sp. Leaf17]